MNLKQVVTVSKTLTRGLQSAMVDDAESSTKSADAGTKLWMMRCRVVQIYFFVAVVVVVVVLRLIRAVLRLRAVF
jgi:hypothetical protein